MVLPVAKAMDEIFRWNIYRQNAAGSEADRGWLYFLSCRPRGRFEGISTPGAAASLHVCSMPQRAISHRRRDVVSFSSLKLFRRAHDEGGFR